MAIREDCERVGILLKRQCLRIACLNKKAKGREKRAILDSNTLVNVLQEDLVTIENIVEEFEEVTLKCDGLEKEIDLLKEEIARMACNRLQTNKGRPMDGEAHSYMTKEGQWMVKHTVTWLSFAQVQIFHNCNNAYILNYYFSGRIMSQS